MIDSIFGLTQGHLSALPDGTLINSDVVTDWLAMQQAAAKSGFALSIASGFRDFERQKRIWNNKFLGLLPVYDDQGQILDLNSLSDLEKVTAILRFSAFPGLSRHHWGTDVDVYDSSTIDQDYKLQLVEHEYTDHGPFAELSLWLDDHASEFGFYKPYQHDLGGVAREPWHLSHHQAADIYLNELSQLPLEEMQDFYLDQDIAGIKAVLDNWQSLFSRFVTNISLPSS